jgi:HTH-type transcriptional regulator/antitoxin HigA
MHDRVDSKKYGELLAEVLPCRIETEKENEHYLKIVERMMDRGAEKFSPEEDKLFDLLVTLIEEFEEEAYPMGNSTPRDMLLFLMEQQDLKQTDLLGVFGSKGIVSEVVNGKRAISKTHAKRLAEKFKVSAELFI